MTDDEHLNLLELESQLKFARGENKKLKKEITRLKALLNGEDIIKNSLTTGPFDKLKSSYRYK